MLNGKTAVITGASRGIGKAIALAMASNGANIAVIYAGREDEARQVCAEAAGLGVMARAYQCDVADFAAVKAVCEQIVADFGSVDILVNNAGITKDSLSLMMSENDFDRVIAVDLKGAFNFIRHLAKFLMRAPAGRIINISSISGLMGNAGQANYSAAKAGLIGLTKTIARELAPRKVTCNAIAPGFIETAMTDGLPREMLDKAHAAIPLQRLGSPDEVAALAVFLASEQASYITGEVIRVDGGMCI
jgi:3-oxoacyl-[acyl-carrier protein] reductase